MILSATVVASWRIRWGGGCGWRASRTTGPLPPALEKVTHLKLAPRSLALYGKNPGNNFRGNVSERLVIRCRIVFNCTTQKGGVMGNLN